MGKKSTLSRLIELMPQAIAELESEGRSHAVSFISANKLLIEEYFMPSLGGSKPKRRQTT